MSAEVWKFGDRLPSRTGLGEIVEIDVVGGHMAFAEVVVCMEDDQRSSVCEARAQVLVTAPELLVACKAQHQAISILLAKLILLEPTFRPTRSEVWPALVQGNAAIAKATGATP